MQPNATTLVALFLAAVIASLSAGCSAQAKKERHLRRAESYFAAGDYDKAEIEYTNVLQIEQLNAEALAKLGQMYFEQTRLGRVYPYLAKARELQPENIEVRMLLGKFYLGVGQIKEAREEATYVLQRRPGDVDAPLVLADSVASEADLKAIREQLQQLPTRDDAPVVTAFGILELRQRRLAEAQKEFDRALAQNSRFVPALLGKANVYWATGDLAHASESFATAAAAAPARSPRRLQYAKFKIQTGDLAAARTFLNDVSTKTPDLLGAWIMLAEVNAAEKKYDEALAALGKVLARDQYHPEAMLLNGRIRLAQGDHQKALSDLERAVKVYPQSPQLQHLLAVTYVANGDVAKATAAATQAVILSPNFVDAIVLLAELNIRQRNYAPALTALRQLVKQQPTLQAPQLLLAQGLRAQGDLTAALEVYLQLEKASPRDPQIPLLSGMVLLQQNQPKDARAAYERSLAIAPNFLPAVEQLLNLDLDEHKFEAARQRVAPLIEKQPNLATLHLLMAKVHLAQNDNTAAEAELQTTAKLQPDLPLTYFLLARIYMSSSQPEKAIANLEQAVANDPKDVKALMLIGILQEQQKNYEKARASYERLLAVNPRFAAALNNLAYVLAEHLGDADKAFEFAQRARELQPGEPHVADTLGWVLYRKHQYSWAAILLTESADRLPDVPAVHLHLGMTQYMLGDQAEASRSLQKALNMNASVEGADSARRALAVLAIDPEHADATAIGLLEQAAAAGDNTVAWFKLGRIHRQRGELPQAEQAFEAALKTNPANVPSAIELMSLLLELKKRDQALTLATNIRKLSPTDPDIALAVGQTAFKSGDHVWAASLLQEAARARPQNPDAAYWLGLASYAVGKTDQAESEMKRALALSDTFARAENAREFLHLLGISTDEADPSTASAIDAILLKDAQNPAAMMVAAKLAEHGGDRAAAMRRYEELLKAYPECSPAMRGLIILAAQAETAHPTALQYATKARAAFPEDQGLGKALGILWYLDQQHARAIPVLREASRAQPQDAKIVYYLGRAEIAAKEAAAGKRSLQRALELGLNPQEAEIARRLLAPTSKESSS